MSRATTRLLAVIACSLWLTHAAPAAAWDYRGGLTSAWQQVSEREDGDGLVDEQGLVAGVTGAGSITSGDWQFGVDGGAFGGKLDYDGSTQFGAPLATSTEWYGWHVGVGFERRFLVPMPVNIGGGLEYQRRNRDILPTATVNGLKERYETVWLGLRGAIHPTSFAVVEFNAGCAIASEVEVKFEDTFDDTTLTLNDHCRARVAADIDIAKFGTRTLFLRPFAGWERYPASESERLNAGGAGVGTIYVPETEFTTFGITLGIRGRRE